MQTKDKITHALPTAIYNTVQIRQLEKLAYQECKLTEDELMERAGLAAYEALITRWPEANRILVFCGNGNNGGDGYVLARIAAENKKEVEIFQVGDHAYLKGPALNAANKCIAAKIAIKYFTINNQINADVIVDSIFGIGLNKDVADIFATAVHTINSSNIPVLAIDIPSGLQADNGTVLGTAIRAKMTITMIGLKLGLITGAGLAYCGEINCANLLLPEKLFNEITPLAQRLNQSLIPQVLKSRSRDAHKGNFGHVLIIGGDYGMPGAARMAAEAACRVGAGLVSVATRPEHVAVISSMRPEIMCHGIKELHELNPLLERATIIVIGPGLGRSAWSESLFKMAIAANKQMLIDADGLYWLADYHLANNKWIITPHPGEAAKLLSTSTSAIQSDRLAAAALLQQQFGGVAVLKGAGTIVIGNSYSPAICINGNPGMASGGMGDMLSGVIAGLFAQGIPAENAAELGVLIHAMAGDIAAQEGERGLLAMDLLPYIRNLANPK